MLKSLFLFFSFMTMANASFYQLANNAHDKVVGVRVDDVVKFLGNPIPELANINNALKKSPESYMTSGIQKELLNLYISDMPTYTRHAEISIPLTALVILKDNRIVFENFNVVSLGKVKTANDIRIERGQAIFLSQTDLKVEVGLVARKAIVKDDRLGIKMVFPLGVGSFEPAVLHDNISLLTPRFQTGYLDKRTAIKSRKKPRYFAGKPFIRITTDRNPSDGHTGIGFHAQPNLKTFIRAFDSHGCMRMQLDDLNTLFYLVSEGPRQQLPIKVLYHLQDESEHPHPKLDSSFQRVANIGTYNNPRYDIDRDGLIQLQRVSNSTPPFASLIDNPLDQFHNLFDYDLDWREKDRIQKHNEDCAVRFVDSKKEYSRCVKEGKRTLNLSEKLYRFWVH